jgi:hypothetical protein
MATATLSPAPKLQFFDANGNPLVGGKLYSYAAGTTTPLATYTGNTTTTANSNPVILNSRGEAGVWLSSSYYKLKLTDSNDVEIWTVDNVGGFATMADLTAAINALTASLAASSGSSLIGFIQAGTGAVATTAQAKMREQISVKDFGAVGNDSNDDTTSIQAAINYANTIGGDVYFPAGTYRITNGLTINNSGDITARLKASLYGDSSASVLIRGAAGNYDMLTITGGTGAGAESHQVIRGLFFVKEDYVGFCIGGDNLAFLSLEDVCCYNGEYAFYATDVLSSVFYNCIFRQAKIGMRAEYTNFSYPNALTLVGCVIGNNQDAGVWIIGGTTFNMFGGSIESNGIDGVSATKFGALLSNSGVQGSVSGNFSGVYFENNKGTADIWLTNSAQPAAASISGCSFARVDDVNYVTNNILVETSGAGVTQSVSVAGCGFKYFNDYVPNSGRKYINAISTSSGVSTVAWSGCVFQSATETPTITNEIQLTGGGGGFVTAVTGTAPVVSSGGTTPAISMAAASGSVNGYLTSTDWNTFNGKASTAFPGWNSVTFQNSWSDAGFPSPLCSYYKDAFSVVRLQGGAIRGSNSSATIFTLPSGYRPASVMIFPVYGEVSSVATLSIVTIDTSGNVSMLPAGNTVGLNSITFQTN